MVTTTHRKNEIVLAGTPIKISSPVQVVTESAFPEKIVIGDTTKDSQKLRSVVTFGWRDGIGKYRTDGNADINRAWYSTASLSFDGHLVLPPLATTTAGVGGAGDDTANVMIEYGGGVYIDASGAIYTYDDQADSWGSSLHTLPEPASDAIVIRLGGTVYLVFAHRNGYTYYDGTTWTDDTEDMIYVTFWNDQLWGIDRTGQLRKCSTIGSWTDDAILPLEDGVVTDLFVSGDASNVPIIYAMTTKGLFAHDNSNTKFLLTELGMPQHPTNGKGSRRWRGGLYPPSGLGVYEYISDGQPAEVNLVGPDLDDGLPSDRKGSIVQLEGSNNRLFGGVAASTATPLITSSISSIPVGLDAFSGSVNRGRGTVRPVDKGRSLVLAWSGESGPGVKGGGWEVAWESDDDTQGITTMLVSGAYGKHRLWWAHNKRVLYMDLPIDIINPSQVTTFEYGSTFKHHTPWFTGGDAVANLALLLRAESLHPTTAETLTIGYRRNYSTGAFTKWGPINSSGETELPFPVSGDGVGVPFRAIQFEVEGNRDTTKTNSPDLVALTLEWLKIIPPRATVTVDCVLTDYRGKKAETLRAAISSALASGTLVKLIWGPDATQSKIVQVIRAPGIELTGLEERGNVQVTMVEP
tara:strand:- start:2430 stop:4337 length:1908 start_codon:yes stop_codon:yes gene_type:complete